MEFQILKDSDNNSLLLITIQNILGVLQWKKNIWRNPEEFSNNPNTSKRKPIKRENDRGGGFYKRIF